MSGSVTKLENVSSCGKPAIRFKSLKDVVESEDAKRISSNSAVEDNKVKTEGSYQPDLPLADRTLRKEEFGSFEPVSNDYAAADDEDMSDDASMTLSQLKEICKKKKQKLSHCTHSTTKQVCDNFQFGDDEFNLKEPLIQWKHKLSKKTPKRKRKFSTERDIRFELALLDMSEQMVGCESFTDANRDLMSLVCVKREDPESESFEVPSPIAFIDVEEPNDDVMEGHAYKNQELVLYGDGYQEDFPDSPEDIEIDGCDSFHQVLCIEECRDCVLNELCYDHLESIPLLEGSANNIVYLSDEMLSCQPHLVSSTPESDSNDKSNNIFPASTREFVMPQKDQIFHVSESFNDSHVMNKTSGQISCSLGVQAVDTAVNSKIEMLDPLPPTAQNGSFSLKQSVSSFATHACASLDDESGSTNEGTVERDQSQECSFIDSLKDCRSPMNPFPPLLPTTSEKQPHETASLDTESGSSSRTAMFIDDYTLSALVRQNPGRFTQKIIPPISQEHLSMTLNCKELHNNADDDECKEKLFFEGKNKTDPSIARSNIETTRVAENTAQPKQLNRRRVVISPSQLHQKAKKEMQGFPPKGNLEQPCYSRSLPCINTGCTSVTSCSKGAIAFSQRQMHDIDSLAGKLLNELKSMKNIVEQKLLLNSCRSLTLRNDADEVVEAIKTATRVEESAKRMLSGMARDCNRYCKIMSLTQDGPSSDENETNREKRKIVFADEAGETLCHVKFFENGSTSDSPLAQKPDNQIF